LLFVSLPILAAAQGQVPSGTQGGSPKTAFRMTDAKAGPGSSAPRSSDPLPKDLQGEDLSGSPTPRLDPKGSIVPEYFDWRPRMSLGAVASLRKDELTGKAAWDEAQEWSLQRWFDLPNWVSLTLEERVRYESYATPWIANDTRGQYAIPIQSVVWFQARPREDLRFELEFWDARQYGPMDPNKIDTTMVNTLNFEQIFAAKIDRNVAGSGIDSETKAGQMHMDVGSRRLIGIVPFKNTQFQFVGMQNRLRDPAQGWELLTFANVPVNMLPNTTEALVNNRTVWNRPLTDAVFAGSHFDLKIATQDRFEFYFYYLHEGEAANLSRDLYTPGFRFYRDSHKGEFDYELETIGQTGSKRVSESSAPEGVGSVMQHVQAGYNFDWPMDPRLLLQWDYASSHFDSLFPSTVFEYGPDGILTLFARTNLNSPGYRFFLVPHRDLTLYAANRFWWLADPRSTTGWANAQLVDTSGQAGSYIGQTWELNGRWDAHDNISFQLGWQVLMKGNFALYAPDAPTDSSNVNYWFVQTEIRF
jgi:hypothetical protein